MAIFQVFWCARMRSTPIYGHVVIAGVTSAMSLGAIFQVFWCARMRSTPIYGHVVIAGVTSAMSLGAGIYVLVVGKESATVSHSFFYTNDRYYDDDKYDNCLEKTWFIIALLCALLWAASAACLFYFVKSGRHAKWEDKHSGTINSNGSPAVELAATSARAEGDATTGEGEVVVADAAVLQSVKVDDV
eukprot:CAMPEP_0197282838 /NCGR_PEP_ID=MMETSP1432-20130617/24626_1 /TAXON_ID=44447 /ORGANISM="Pseudo-nitzschia delicatissima, Strain UNC1205" /LENGTH=187 /DNA_ID=CAMNT_0042749817 /DNA_START=329 /DNA_END=893 /DNA_ORIENTATION=-